MAHTLNYNTIEKQYLTVTLADENNTVLMVGTPTKAVMKDLLLLEASVDAIEEDETNLEALDDLYTACARVMSRNKLGRKITKEYLEELFDIEDIMLFFRAYIDFVTTLSNAKN